MILVSIQGQVPTDDLSFVAGVSGDDSLLFQEGKGHRHGFARNFAKGRGRVRRGDYLKNLSSIVAAWLAIRQTAD
jgi:hypothetical protein